MLLEMVSGNGMSYATVRGSGHTVPEYKLLIFRFLECIGGGKFFVLWVVAKLEEGAPPLTVKI